MKFSMAYLRSKRGFTKSGPGQVKIDVSSSWPLILTSQKKRVINPSQYSYTNELENVEMNKYLEKIASDLHSKFTPDVTPERMRQLGVLHGRYDDLDPMKHNYFKVDASMKDWPAEWIHENNPKGWFDWYESYHSGNRGPDDERQIKRWISFKARHLAQLTKADPSLVDLSIQPRRRQALLNWAIAPGISKEAAESLKTPVILVHQRHFADKAGEHIDWRVVVGEKAYSWATKKEMPEPGKKIILHEQPIHDREYALSERIVIPKGQYGAGTTTLEYAQKGVAEIRQADVFKLRLNNGHSFTIKKLEKLGPKAWLLINTTATTPASTSTTAAATNLGG